MLQIIEDDWFLKKTLGDTKNSKVRLFLFPPAGGDISTYFSWEKSFPIYTETCFLKLPGRGKRIGEPLISNIDIIVDNIIDEMKNMQDVPFLFFGHSMGALIAYETALRCYKMKLKLPEKLIVSGMKAPDILSDINKKINHIKLHNAEDEQLRNIILNLGGMPDIFKENKEFLDILMPIFRNDLKLCETYEISGDIKLPIDIDILGGDRDALSSIEELEGWSKCSLNNVNTKYFKGGHFYFYDNMEEFIKFISESIGNVKDNYKKKAISV